MRSPLVACESTTLLHDRWGKFILYYKSTELIKICKLPATSPYSTVFIHTTFSLLQTGATVPLSGLTLLISSWIQPTAINNIYNCHVSSWQITLPSYLPVVLYCVGGLILGSHVASTCYRLLAGSATDRFFRWAFIPLFCVEDLLIILVLLRTNPLHIIFYFCKSANCSFASFIFIIPLTLQLLMSPQKVDGPLTQTSSIRCCKPITMAVKVVENCWSYYMTFRGAYSKFLIKKAKKQICYKLGSLTLYSTVVVTFNHL